MDRSFKNKNRLVIALEVFLIIIGLVGATFATSKLLGSSSKTTITTGMYEVDYKGNLEVKGTNLEPISDSKININTTESVMRAEFSLRGSDKNDADDLIYDIVLKDINIDCSLLNEYTKWNLYKNGELLSHGNFSPKFDGDVKNENLYLTNIQEDLKDEEDSYDNYVFLVWISESCDDLTKCTYVDQSDTINKDISMTTFIAVYRGEKLERIRKPNNDLSCANAPRLEEQMIPVFYEDGSWKIADKNNNINEWYNYDKGRWANAITTNNKLYFNMEIGSKVEESDISSMFVWIPRYKYLTWNVEEELKDSYDAYNKGIDIVFEPGLSTSKNENKVNDTYLSHQAFTNSKGFWISKYELGLNENKLTIKNNQKPLLNEDIDIYEELIKTYNEEFKFTSKIINNLEWGATLYLSHSKYGTCKNNSCLEIENNEETTSGNNKYDSTTRNVYGVFDMSGSAAEYVTGSYDQGDATKEITLPTGAGWYDSYIILGTDYSLRGGVGSNAFQQESFGMGNYTTRITIK